MSDEFDEVPVRRAASFPMIVKIAGGIWIAFGGLILLNAIIALVMKFGGTPAAGGDGVPGANICGSVLPILFGAVFIMVGFQTIQGKARDTLGNGIGSIIFGMLCGGVGAMAMLGGAILSGEGGAKAELGPLAMIVGAINTISGAGLLIAGVLALVGRSGYKEWRRMNQR